MALLTVENLSLGYEGREVLRGVSFEVNQGDYLCIVGENGSGKTTLMKTILGLQAPLGGRVLTGDGLKHSEIGYLPQQTEVQRDFPASVREVVSSGLLNRQGFRPFLNKEEKELVKKTLRTLGIAELEKRCYRDLSGGQQQRALLARALCATRRLLLLDEPVAGLDPGAAKEMYALVEELHRAGITVIMISHDLEAALTYATHVLHVGDDVFFG
ncbi:MAG: metal ABC transporter ATP-binding protein, partial [Clostridia bacterium]|nr:metal ABC transporter ATP-binding protein [Clostridia bacterium]